MRGLEGLIEPLPPTVVVDFVALTDVVQSLVNEIKGLEFILRRSLSPKKSGGEG